MNPNNLSAIRCWLMARVAWPTDDVGEEELKDILIREAQSINGLPVEDLIKEANAHRDPHRSERFLSWSWRSEPIALSDFGTWWTVGDALPIEACRRSAVEAAEFIRQNPDLSRFTPDPGKQARYAEHVARIRRQAKYSEVIRAIPLLAVLVAERGRRGRENCERVKYSCEDGSHRAIAMALAGYETISAWIAS